MEEWQWMWGDGGSVVLAEQCCREEGADEGHFVAFAERHCKTGEVRFRIADEAGLDPRPVAFCPYCGGRLQTASQVAWLKAGWLC